MEEIFSASFDKTGQFIVTGTPDSRVWLWNTPQKQEGSIEDLLLELSVLTGQKLDDSDEVVFLTTEEWNTKRIEFEKLTGRKHHHLDEEIILDSDNKYRETAQRFFRLGDREQSLANWKEVLKRNRHDAEAVQQIALLSSGKPMLTLQQLTEADNFLEKRNWDATIEIYDDLLKQHPDDPDIYLSRSNAYVQQNTLQEDAVATQFREAAFADLNKAIELDKNHQAALLARAEYYLSIADYQNALADAQQAIELVQERKSQHGSFRVSELRKGYLLSSETYQKLDQPKKIVETWSLFIKNNPDDDYGYRKRAQIHYELDNTEEFLADWNKVLELKPDDPEATRQLALASSGKTIADLKQIDALMASYHALRKEKKFDEAWETARKAMRLYYGEYKPAGECVPIALTRANQGLQAYFPRGDQVLEGVQFQVSGKRISLKGNPDETLPEKIEGIPVDQQVGKLHLLHWLQGSTKEGLQSAHVIVHYDDQTSVTIKVISAENVLLKQHYPNLLEIKRGRIAWIGSTRFTERNKSPAHLSMLTWDNPHPEKKIATIDFVSDVAGSQYYCAAVTAELPPEE